MHSADDVAFVIAALLAARSVAVPRTTNKAIQLFNAMRRHILSPLSFCRRKSFVVRIVCMKYNRLRSLLSFAIRHFDSNWTFISRKQMKNSHRLFELLGRGALATGRADKGQANKFSASFEYKYRKWLQRPQLAAKLTQTTESRRKAGIASKYERARGRDDH